MANITYPEIYIKAICIGAAREILGKNLEMPIYEQFRAAMQFANTKLFMEQHDFIDEMVWAFMVLKHPLW